MGPGGRRRRSAAPAPLGGTGTSREDPQRWPGVRRPEFLITSHLDYLVTHCASNPLLPSKISRAGSHHKLHDHISPWHVLEGVLGQRLAVPTPGLLGLSFCQQQVTELREERATLPSMPQSQRMGTGVKAGNGS